MSTSAKFHPLYKRWRFIVDITSNPNNANYKKYGQYTYTTFESWREFCDYVMDNLGMPQSALSRLARKDLSKGFEPGNLHWLEPLAYGRRQPQVLYMTYKRSTKPLRAWADEYGIKFGTIFDRYRAGWTPAQCLGIEVRPRESRSSK